MGYVTQEYYKDSFHGEPVADEDFPVLMSRASELVEEMTLYRLSQESFQLMPQIIRDKVMDAVCAQIEYLDANGGSDADNGTDLASASLGRFSYTKAGPNSGAGSGCRYAPRAQRILMPTGLLYRGGGSY